MHPELIGGRYRVGRSIGQGGMGTVWLCRDEKLQRDVAIKQVGMFPGQSVTDSARALREARSSAALSHRNVVTVFDVVEEDGSIWLVMEHVPSRSLADIIKHDGPLPPAKVADIGAQVADGLAAAHAAGTMHRDVKPGNVLIREDGTAKISDFGIARSAGDPALTQSGFLTGTPSYFSPELARGASPGPAADVWALGATLYAAVEGRPPYRQHENPVAVLHDIASQQPPAPRHADFLEPVLLRMMDRNPDSRWSMADAAHALRRLAREHAPERTRANTMGLAPAAASRTGAGDVRVSHPVEPDTQDRRPRAATPAPPPASSAGTERSGRHRGAYAALLLLALLLVGGGIAYAVMAGGEDPGSGTAGSGASRSSTPSEPRSSTSTSSSPSRSASPSASESASESASPSATASTSPSPSASATVASSSKAAFIRSYFATAPGGTDEGWARLGPTERSQGRASYNSFWRGISSVSVTSVRPVPGSDSVDVTLTYRRTNGTTSTERKQFDLVRSSDGGYLINDERPVG
jgi:serine/threonine protein kinase